MVYEKMVQLRSQEITIKDMASKSRLESMELNKLLVGNCTIFS